MDEEPKITIVIVKHKNHIPSVACSVPARVIITNENGDSMTDFEAEDVFVTAARGMADRMKPEKSAS